MDNISRRRQSNEEDASCTANTMYLSFDAESTMSCYRTMTDVSSMSALSIIDDHIDNKHMNSTLENTQDLQQQSPLKTVKKMDLVTCSPLRALPKNILREYKALSSTPSREQLMKTVDVTRGSDASRCVDLGIAFLGVEDEQPAYFPQPLKQHAFQEDNKENTIPEVTIDGSTLSVSSSVDTATSLVEKRLNSVSTTSSHTGDESENAITIIDKHLMNSASAPVAIMSGEYENKLNEVINYSEMNVETLPKAVDELSNLHIGDIVKANFEEGTPTILITKVPSLMEGQQIGAKATTSGKRNIAIYSSRNARRSVCEPNMITNKPSRILATSSKRQSLLPITQKKTIAQIEPEDEIPLLMNKMLKISNSSEVQQKQNNIQKKEKNDDIKSNDIKATAKPTKPTEKRHTLMPASKGRNSLMPSSVGEKRPFSFANRMSVVVKTTLNSPARKVARKSVMAATSSLATQQRRSLMTTKMTQTIRSNKMDTGVRHSMLPNIKRNTNIAASNPLQRIQESTTAQKRKSTWPINNPAEERASYKAPQLGGARPKEYASLTCNVCKEKFRIKSLLDAHKRSHEGDVAAPTAVSKKQAAPLASNTNSGGTSSFNKVSQCKYCDKKFALVRALHIHLLQNCPKIPPLDKRKLEYTEMNHVEKARLPSVFHHAYETTSSAATSTKSTPRVGKPNVLMQNPKATVDNLQEIDQTTKTAELQRNRAEASQEPNVNSTVAAAGSVQKIKKPTAHSGIYRTPSKTVPCHTCKLTFKSILDYTNHCLTEHNSKTQKKMEDRDSVPNRP